MKLPAGCPSLLPVDRLDVSMPQLFQVFQSNHGAEQTQEVLPYSELYQ